MKKTSDLFFKALFNEGEQVCVSPNKYAFSSISQDLISNEFSIESQNKDRAIYTISEDDILLVAMNPIKGDRSDRNVTSLRTFLVEIDGEDVYEQKKYIESLGMPYTICVFSGNKSLHYGITLSEDIHSEEMWRDINEWILAIVSKADQQTKNPSRSIRFPGNQRKDGKALQQQLIDIKDRVDLDILFDWLDQWPDKNPRLKKAANRRKVNIPAGTSVGIPAYIVTKLNEGVGRQGSRNSEWFKVVATLASKGYSEEGIMAALQFYFVPEHDFTFREWDTIIKSAVKRIERGFGE